MELHSIYPSVLLLSCSHCLWASSRDEVQLLLIHFHFCVVFHHLLFILPETLTLVVASLFGGCCLAVDNKCYEQSGYTWRNFCRPNTQESKYWILQEEHVGPHSPKQFYQFLPQQEDVSIFLNLLKIFSSLVMGVSISLLFTFASPLLEDRKTK